MPALRCLHSSSLHPIAALALALPALLCTSCKDKSVEGSATPAASSPQVSAPPPAAPTASGGYLGFDRNDYPGDDTMRSMRQRFAFTGYWLTPPPGATTNSWEGKRKTLLDQGWGFLVLANGKLEKEILKARSTGVTPEELGRSDAGAAVSAATREKFPDKSIIFLDQEEGGRLTEPQAAYLLAWTEAVASSNFKAGVYASGQPVSDAPGTTITTIRDIRDRAAKLRQPPIAFFAAQDQCPPAPGCTVEPKPISAAGLPDLAAWQYSQSPRRPEITKSCAATYAADNNCYAPGFPKVFLDMDVAPVADPSHGSAIQPIR